MLCKNYKALGLCQIKIRKYSFDVVSLRNSEQIRLWRNSEQNLLRQSGDIGYFQQKLYFLKSVFLEKFKEKPRNILFSISDGQILVGYTGLVHIDWENNRAELSFLLDPKFKKNDPVDCEIFYEWLDFASYVAFFKLNLSKITTETFEHRKSYCTALENYGFEREGYLKWQYINGSEHVSSYLHAMTRNNYTKKSEG